MPDAISRIRFREDIGAAAPGRISRCWSKSFRDQRITTEAQMKALAIPDGGYIAQVQRQWALTWQEVTS